MKRTAPTSTRPVGVAAQVVEAGDALVGAEQRAHHAVADVLHVPARHHQPAVGVEGDAADAATLRDDDLERARSGSTRYTPPWVTSLTYSSPVGADGRTLDEAEAGRQRRGTPQPRVIAYIASISSA